MSKYRSHNCNALRATNEGETVRLAGWAADIRNVSKSLMFITVRDHYGKTQLVFSEEITEAFELAKTLKPESIIIIEGVVKSRGKDNNPNMATGEIEVIVSKLTIDSLVENLPFQLHENPGEDLRLKYRFIDLRRSELQEAIKMRFKMMMEIRNFLAGKNFLEIQTPILTASSPEGARDYVVPSRLYPGKFYALPQAPQQYKQLLMCSGFDRYFQIAPCFRDENARADRSPGEFYQLDMEMAFITQDELFALLEEMYQYLVPKVCNKKMQQFPFPRIKFHDSMEWYGNDKPDIRYDMKMQDLTQLFGNSEFKVYKEMHDTSGKCVKAILVKGASNMARKFFDNAQAVAKEYGAFGIGYIQYGEEETKGSVVKALSENELSNIKSSLNAETGDAVLLIAGERKMVNLALGKVRSWVASELKLADTDTLAFCWIVDFPMYEFDDEKQAWDFSHNPFSMPQGEMAALDKAIESGDYAAVSAYQYDIVCNGIELSSGAIRNHRPDIMYKAFEIVGYPKEEVDRRFGHMINAFKFGAPPHGGIAPGLDRMLMVFSDKENIREVIAFPLNQQAKDLMMGSPSEITDVQWNELGLMLKPEKK
jgi:aspartyl-tRNA synthetase